MNAINDVRNEKCLMEDKNVFNDQKENRNENKCDAEIDEVINSSKYLMNQNVINNAAVENVNANESGKSTVLDILQQMGNEWMCTECKRAYASEWIICPGCYMENSFVLTGEASKSV